MKEHQKISVGATLHVALDNLSRIEAILEQPSDFHEIVSDDVPVSRRTVIHDEVRELRRIIEDVFERFSLSPTKDSRRRLHSFLNLSFQATRAIKFNASFTEPSLRNQSEYISSKLLCALLHPFSCLHSAAFEG